MLDLLQSKCNSFRLISSVINSLSFFALVRFYGVEFTLLSAFSMRYYTCTVHQILIEFRKNLEEPVEKLSLQIFPQLKLNLTYTSLCKESENSRVRFVHNSIHLFPCYLWVCHRTRQFTDVLFCVHVDIYCKQGTKMLIKGQKSVCSVPYTNDSLHAC